MQVNIPYMEHLVGFGESIFESSVSGRKPPSWHFTTGKQNWTGQFLTCLCPGTGMGISWVVMSLARTYMALGQNLLGSPLVHINS